MAAQAERIAGNRSELQSSVLRGVQLGGAQVLTFEGRTARADYWYFVGAVAVAIGLCNFGLADRYRDDPNEAQIVVIFALSLVPLSATVRRLHDIGRSGWWSLLGVFVLHWLCRAGDVGSNRYGPPSGPSPAAPMI